jgi:hypothetical protein
MPERKMTSKKPKLRRPAKNGGARPLTELQEKLRLARVAYLTSVGYPPQPSQA